MERMLVVIFNDESKAYKGADTLESLKEEGAIGLTGEWVLMRQQDGDVSIVKTDDTLPEGTMGGTVVGGLIGLFGGPVGLAIGAATGAAAGATADMARARLDQDFVADISESLAPGKTALVAEINEDEPEAVDARMHALGGRVIRRDLSDFVDADNELRANEVKLRVDSRRESDRARLQNTQAKPDVAGESVVSHRGQGRRRD